jgi:hypothetical protein
LPRAAVYVKQYDGAQHAEWVDQPFVYDHSRGASFYTPSIGGGQPPRSEPR